MRQRAQAASSLSRLVGSVGSLRGGTSSRRDGRVRRAVARPPRIQHTDGHRSDRDFIRPSCWLELNPLVMDGFGELLLEDVPRAFAAARVRRCHPSSHAMYNRIRGASPSSEMLCRSAALTTAVLITTSHTAACKLSYPRASNPVGVRIYFTAVRRPFGRPFEGRTSSKRRRRRGGERRSTSCRCRHRPCRRWRARPTWRASRRASTRARRP